MSTETPEIETSPETSHMRANMGNRYVVPYAVYRGTVTYLPQKGARLGVTADDLRKFFEGLTCGFELARASARPGVNLRRLLVWEFEGTRGPSEMVLRDAVSLGYDTARNPEPVSWDDVVLTFNPQAGGSANLRIWADGSWNAGTEPSYNPANRFLAVGVIEAVDSNPNGDPNNGNAPRQYPDGRGWISYESVKRVIRDYLATEYSEKLMMAREADLGSDQDAYIKTHGNKAADAFRADHLDVRLFGGVHPRFAFGPSAERSCGAIVVSPFVTPGPLTVERVAVTRVAGHGKVKK